MAIVKYLYRKSDGVFLSGGSCDIQPPLITGPVVDGKPTQVPDFTTYGVAEFGDADQPDLRLHRYDAVLGKRLATAPEQASHDDARVVDAAALTSRQRDILATVAFIIRRSDVVAWNATTPAQKKAAVLAAADVWRDLRVAIDKF